MLQIKGINNIAKVYTDKIEERAMEQIKEICDQEFSKDSKIRIMPDCHSGKGCVIGFTMTIKDKIVPNFVGVDIGCGMLTIKLGDVELDLKKIDNYILNNIPHGRKNNNESKVDNIKIIESLKSFEYLEKESIEFNKALGSLGGGNHFIEINIDKNNNKYLVIHTGSRNLGHRVASYYQNKAYEYHNGINTEFIKEKEELIKNYKIQGRGKEIQNAVKLLIEKYKKDYKIPKELCYLEYDLMNDYLYDMDIVQKYAHLNRNIIGKRIIEECIGFDYDLLEKFQTIHNYIDMENKILRKGSISAKKGEKVLIPMNMRDGSIICIGKGNEDWNYSAPHGAGRLMSRTKAKELLNMSEFENTMKDIYTTSVKESTLDEAPMAYKPMEEILKHINDTVEIIDIIKPIYNFKA